MLETKSISSGNVSDLEKFGEPNIYLDGETPFLGPASEEKIEKIIKEYLKRKGL
jgi:hypothetical protein